MIRQRVEWLGAVVWVAIGVVCAGQIGLVGLRLVRSVLEDVDRQIAAEVLQLGVSLGTGTAVLATISAAAAGLWWWARPEGLRS